jgi:hypothetical protein
LQILKFQIVFTTKLNELILFCFASSEYTEYEKHWITKTKTHPSSPDIFRAHFATKADCTFRFYDIWIVSECNPFATKAECMFLFYNIWIVSVRNQNLN